MFERLEAIRREQKLDDPIKIAEAIRIGAPICDVNAHLNYVSSSGIDVWNSDLKHANEIITDFTKPGNKISEKNPS